MITMVDKQTIIHMYRVKGYSKRAIAREVEINRKTVHKIIAEYEASLSSEDPEASLETLLTTSPRYDTGKRKRRIIVGSIKEVIDDCLEKNAHKRASGLKKQCMLKKDIYNLLVSQGFTISYPSVCKYITGLETQKNSKTGEAFIRQHYNPGENCEFDWGEVKLYIHGKLQRFFMAVFTFSHSNGRYAWLFRHQNTLAFMESHRNFFRQVRGVPYVMVYDNMRVAVKEFVGTQKTPTQALMRMCSFYKFAYRFCNVRAGWEKGHVERSVEYVRRKAFSTQMSFESIEEAQAHLDGACGRMNEEVGSLSTMDKQQRLAADIAALQPHMNEMGCFELVDYKVDKWSTVCLKSSHYSVPDTLVGKTVSVKIYSEKLVVLYLGNKIAVHERIYGPGGWSVRLEHYVGTLLRKPGAVHGSLALKQASEKMQQLFNVHFKDSGKDFVLLLQYAKENGFTENDIAAASEALKKRGRHQISADQIKVLMHAQNETQEPIEVKMEDERQSGQSQQIEDGAMNILLDLTRMMKPPVIENNIVPLNK